MFSDYGFTHITLKDLIEYTVHEVLFLLKLLLTIYILSRHVIWIQDFITTVGCGSDRKIPFECSKVLLILEDGVLGNFSFDALFEVHRVLSIGTGFQFRWSLVSRWRGATIVLFTINESPGHEIPPCDLAEVLWEENGKCICRKRLGLQN